MSTLDSALGAAHPSTDGGQSAGQTKGLSPAPAQGAQCCGQSSGQSKPIQEAMNWRAACIAAYILICGDGVPEMPPPPPPEPAQIEQPIKREGK